jgi:hypothetical protein
MPIREKVLISNDNSQKLVEAIKQNVPVTLSFTPGELNATDESQPGTLTNLLLLPQQARALRAAREHGADLQLRMTPAMVRQQSGGGIWDMVKSFGASALKGAAQGALQGAINHVTGQSGEGIHMAHVHLSDHQKKKIKEAMEKGRSVSLKLNKESMEGHDKIPLTGMQHRHHMAAKDGKKGMSVTLEHHHLMQHGGDMGDFFKNIIGIGAKILPMLL